MRSHARHRLVDTCLQEPVLLHTLLSSCAGGSAASVSNYTLFVPVFSIAQNAGSDSILFYCVAILCKK
eukprot:scaffold2464_cov104-Cylindrotheca_fusiformis.AAC.1